jgi:D-sedoheptulose 7-phosphate isomerase
MKLNSYLKQINECISYVSQETLDELIDLTKTVIKKGVKFYFIGNGASNGLANHTALDFWKCLKIKALCPPNTQDITALANDYGVDKMFSEHCDMFLYTNDILVAISSSGESKNVIETCIKAKENGNKIITLTAMKSTNTLKTFGDINIYIPAKTYGLAETCHQLLLHYWIDKLHDI